MSRVITFVTGNQNKLREVQAIIESSPSMNWKLESRALDGALAYLH